MSRTPSIATIKSAIGIWTEEREQVFAVADAILRGLKGKDGCYNEFILAGLICDLLGSMEPIKLTEEMLNGST